MPLDPKALEAAARAVWARRGGVARLFDEPLRPNTELHGQINECWAYSEAAITAYLAAISESPDLSNGLAASNGLSIGQEWICNEGWSKTIVGILPKSLRVKYQDKRYESEFICTERITHFLRAIEQNNAKLKAAEQADGQ